MANSELPERENKRGGPGWWMDLDGVWQSPTTWPEDIAPLDGWVRDPSGSWRNPEIASQAEPIHPEQRYAVAVATPSSVEAPRRSRQAQADLKAMFTVAGILGGAALLLAVALILITQASAEDPEPEDATASVIFAAETDQVRQQRRTEVALFAPDEAVHLLAGLSTRDNANDPSGFDPLMWVAERTECLDIADQVLVERSQQPVVWADQLGCVPDRGSWSDRYLGTVITRTLDADVILHVPASIVSMSGGDTWTGTTRQAFLTDVAHPATLEIVGMGSGHNPRSQDPSAWKPSQKSQWCAYAVDWVAVKSRWDLTVTESERQGLTTMLDTCGTPDSAGADPATMVIDELAQPVIERISSE